MHAYVYRCPQCHASSTPGTRAEAAEAQRVHRDSVHGGLIPHGDFLQPVAGRAARDPETRYVSSCAVGVGLVLLAVAEGCARVLGG
ncbi:hypothetical protein [Streptomyces sp. NPDC060194]|uniref:hypothetical protein n=1 Tax=Streptomyces sp. NPDC060194 TaxID=3347069 RepID=UPI0036476DDF